MNWPASSIRSTTSMLVFDSLCGQQQHRWSSARHRATTVDHLPLSEGGLSPLARAGSWRGGPPTGPAWQDAITPGSNARTHPHLTLSAYSAANTEREQWYLRQRKWSRMRLLASWQSGSARWSSTEADEGGMACSSWTSLLRNWVCNGVSGG